MVLLFVLGPREDRKTRLVTFSTFAVAHKYTQENTDTHPRGAVSSVTPRCPGAAGQRRSLRAAGSPVQGNTRCNLNCQHSKPGNERPAVPRPLPACPGLH
ncbi:hypothetical protein EYF80_024755 [Liparis tanakae]|uniref:Uncharacterized protein n=1 Tax=Liparis tanakae TaxID=230148 RepID=A0A4Z2HH10_9TELE|nr:hypothetical protein EYF80_024755 [Liparis tanakae]